MLQVEEAWQSPIFCNWLSLERVHWLSINLLNPKTTRARIDLKREIEELIYFLAMIFVREYL